jgi:proline dehydrogenase
VTLDYLGESVHAPAADGEAGREYLGILDRIAAEGLRSHVSIKLTQLGLAIDPELARTQLAALAEQAPGTTTSFASTWKGRRTRRAP